MSAGLDKNMVCCLPANWLNRKKKMAEHEKETNGADQQKTGSDAEDGLSEESTDNEMLMRMRSIDVQLLRISEEMVAGREDTVAELRTILSDIAAITKDRGRMDAFKTIGLVLASVVLGYFLGLN
jgi:hypothetical protein